eukprot:scaffold22487_cov67-Isochrysis_galbana.AAC.1
MSRDHRPVLFPAQQPRHKRAEPRLRPGSPIPIQARLSHPLSTDAPRRQRLLAALKLLSVHSFPVRRHTADQGQRGVGRASLRSVAGAARVQTAPGPAKALPHEAGLGAAR